MADSFSAVQVIDAIKSGKGIMTLAANRLGCTRQTIARYVKTYPTVKEAYDEANESMIDFAESKLLKNIDDGDTTSIIFFLKTKGKNRGYVERSEISGAGGSPFTIIIDK